MHRTAPNRLIADWGVSDMKISRLVLFGLLMTAFSAASAYALPTVTVTWAPNHSPTGGEFILATSDIGTFNSFCLEINEYINPSGRPYYYTLSHGADQRWLGGPSPDPISLGTAWLFSQFATGTLSGYDTNDAA